MTLVDKTDRAESDSISFEFDLQHSPEKVWRALTDPVLLAGWLLPVFDLKLEPGVAFTFKALPQPGWDGIVNCRFLAIEAHRKLRDEIDEKAFKALVRAAVARNASSAGG